MSSSRKRIIAVSLDADNCVFNLFYQLETWGSDQVIKANDVLIAYLLKLAKDFSYSSFEILPGSLRQSYDEDEYNRKNNKTRSFYKELEVLCEHLAKKIKDLKLRKFLTADVNAKLPEGYSFEKALGRVIDGKPHRTCHADYSKVSLLYLQMHKLASENKDADVDFHFIDDRQDLLDGLETFYRNNRDLIPANLTFHLHRYTGFPMSHREPIVGTGPIDFKSEEGFLEMIKNANGGVSPKDPVCFDHGVLPRRLNVPEFKKNRLEANAKVSEEKKIPLNTAEILSGINPAGLSIFVTPPSTLTPPPKPIPQAQPLVATPITATREPEDLIANTKAQLIINYFKIK